MDQAQPLMAGALPNETVSLNKTLHTKVPLNGHDKELKVSPWHPNSQDPNLTDNLWDVLHQV